MGWSPGVLVKSMDKKLQEFTVWVAKSTLDQVLPALKITISMGNMSGFVRMSPNKSGALVVASYVIGTALTSLPQPN